MNINIRTNDQFKKRFEELCESQTMNQTAFIISVTNKIITLCNIAMDDKMHDSIRIRAWNTLIDLGISPKKYHEHTKKEG